MFTAEIIPAAGLPAELRTRWLKFIAEQPSLDGPCFHPDFISGLGQFIPNCHVAVWRQAGEVAGFLPFQSLGRRGARPIPMCDYQAVIGRPELAQDLRANLRSAGLRFLEFDNLLGTQVPRREATRVNLRLSPRVAITAGFDDYLAKLKAAGKSERKVQTGLRVLERDHGKVSFQRGLQDDALLNQMLDWKAKRFAVGDGFPPWVAQSLRHFMARRGAEVAGDLSVLKAGEAVVAVHFGVHAGRRYYYWFPAYNEAYGKYSPGWLLVWFLLKQLNEVNCNTFDFGPGGEAYKEYFANVHEEVGTGLLETSASLARLHRGYARAQQTVRQSSLAQRWVKPAVRWLRGQGREPATPGKA